MTDLSDIQIEAKWPGALKCWDKEVGILRERTLFYEENGFLYAEGLSGDVYTWSVEDQQWYDS